MNKYFNPITEANRVAMLRSHHSGAFLLVEGDSDCRFFYNFVDVAICRIIPAHGKTNVVRTVELLEKRGVPGVLGIVDADFWLVEGITPSGKNIIVTETHDMECLMLVSEALEKVIRERVPGDKMDLVSSVTQELRAELLKLGLPVGYLRWASARENYYLEFDSIDYALLLTSENGLDISKLLQELRKRKRTGNLPNDEDILQLVETLKLQACDPWQICQGHELIALVKYALPRILTKRFGREAAAKVERWLHPPQLERELRQSYSAEQFRVTKLWREICNWEKSNHPYLIIKSVFTSA